jgi:hypothetical protein
MDGCIGECWGCLTQDLLTPKHYTSQGATHQPCKVIVHLECVQIGLSEQPYL